MESSFSVPVPKQHWDTSSALAELFPLRRHVEGGDPPLEGVWPISLSWAGAPTRVPSGLNVPPNTKGDKVQSRRPGEPRSM
ncbi:unnamed protein product [Diplocarpon coronariae]|nr:hypothetical protein JHW43_004333 [Diplocarpon mali]